MPVNLSARANELEWVAADSSNVVAIARDEDFERLFVQFKNGATYVYFDVPSVVWKAMMNSPSLGGFVYNEIRGAKGRKNVNRGDLDYIYSFDLVTGSVAPKYGPRDND
jgi:hypothetical protein